MAPAALRLPEFRVAKGRPLFLCTMCLMAGIVVGTLLGRQWRWWALCLVAVLSLLCAVCAWAKRPVLLPALALFFAAGLSLFVFAIPEWADDPTAPEGEGQIRGQIVAVGRTNTGRAKYTIDRVTLDGQVLDGRVLLTVSDSPRAGEGDWLTAQAELNRPEPSRFYGDFNARGYYLRQGVRFLSFGVLPIIEPVEQRGLFGTVNRARAYTRQVLYGNLSGETAGVVDALLTGSRNGISEQGRNAFSALGLAHLLAVSGLNISLTAGAVWWLCRKARLPMPLSLALSFAALLGYVLFAGPAPSLLRAAVMWMVMMGALLAARRYDGLTSLAGAAMLLLACNPLDLFDAGFQLSFAATAVIMLWAAPALRLLPQRRLLQWLAVSIGITVFVQLMALPMLLWYFGGVSLLSPVANLILVPSSFVLQLGGIVLTAVGWQPTLAKSLGLLLDWYGRFYMDSLQRLAETPLMVKAAVPSGWFFATWTLLVAFLSPAIVRLYRPLRFGAIVLLALLLVFQLSPYPGRLVESGDSMLLHEGGANISVVWRDDGGWHVACADRWTVASSYLAARGVAQVASLYLLDRKPPTTMEPLRSDEGLVVDRIWVPDDWLTGDNGRVLRELVGEVVLTPVSKSPNTFTQWDGGASLTIAADVPVRYIPYALKRSHIALRPMLSDGAVSVLNLGVVQARSLLENAAVGMVVCPSTVAGSDAGVYNISKCGSITVASEGGKPSLTPWRGRWADGLQGNFQ